MRTSGVGNAVPEADRVSGARPGIGDEGFGISYSTRSVAIGSSLVALRAGSYSSFFLTQARSTDIIVFRSRMYSRVPTSTGGVHERRVSSGAFALILNSCGDGCAIIRLPS